MLRINFAISLLFLFRIFSKHNRFAPYEGNSVLFFRQSTICGGGAWSKLDYFHHYAYSMWKYQVQTSNPDMSRFLGGSQHLEEFPLLYSPITYSVQSWPLFTFSLHFITKIRDILEKNKVLSSKWIKKKKKGWTVYRQNRFLFG